MFRNGVPLLAAAYALAAVGTFLITAVVGRVNGAAELGDLALAIATARVLYAASDLGIGAHLSRLIARDRSATTRHASALLAFRAVLVPVIVLIAIAADLVERRGAPLLAAAVAAALGMVSLQAVAESILLAHQRARSAAALTAVSALLVIVACAIWPLWRGQVATFGALYFGAAATGLAAWVTFLRRRAGISLQLRPDWAVVRSELGRSWPIGASVLLGIAALRFPILMLGGYASDSDLGAFAVVDAAVTAAGILQVAISNTTLPAAAAAYRTDHALFRKVVWRSNLTLAAIGLAASAGLATVGGPLLERLFPSKDFSQVIPLLHVTAWSTPCLLLANHNIYLCAAADRERLNIRLMLTWFVAIAGFQIALVPRFGVMGAGWALLLGRLVGLAAIMPAVLSLSASDRGRS